MDDSKLVSNLEFITKHFLVLSLMATILSAGMTYVYAFAYLMAVNYDFILFIDYSDLTKFGLIFAFVFLSVLYIIASSYADRRKVRFSSERERLKSMIRPILGALVVGVALYVTNRNTFHRGLVYSVFDAALLPSFMLMIIVFVDEFNMRKPNLSYRILILLFAFISLSLLGYDRGLALFDKRNFHAEIRMKMNSGQQVTYHDAALIIVLSHHTCFLLGEKSIIVQTLDIDSIKTEPK